MELSTIQKLAANPPPSSTTDPGKIPFMSCREAQAEIARLSKVLGRPVPTTSAKVSDFNRQILELNSQVAAMAATAAAAVPQVSAYESEFPLLAEYARITDPSEKADWYRCHAAAYDAQHRRFLKSTAGQSPSPKPTGLGIVDKMLAIEDSGKRTLFYRNHKEAIDSAYRTKNA